MSSSCNWQDVKGLTLRFVFVSDSLLVSEFCWILRHDWSETETSSSGYLEMRTWSYRDTVRGYSTQIQENHTKHIQNASRSYESDRKTLEIHWTRSSENSMSRKRGSKSKQLTSAKFGLNDSEQSTSREWPHGASMNQQSTLFAVVHDVLLILFFSFLYFSFSSFFSGIFVWVNLLVDQSGQFYYVTLSYV